VAATLLLPVASRQLAKSRGGRAKSWREIVLPGLTGIALYSCVLYYAVTKTTATSPSLMLTTVPVWVIALEWMFLRRRPQPRGLVAVAISLTGAAVIVVATAGDGQHGRINRGALPVVRGEEAPAAGVAVAPLPYIWPQRRNPRAMTT
jgi:drug/metabolite transporter (DMT)-like permease